MGLLSYYYLLQVWINLFGTKKDSVGSVDSARALLSFKDVGQLVDAISEYEERNLPFLYQVIFSVIISFYSLGLLSII